MSSFDFPTGEMRVPVEGFVSPGMSDLNDWATHKAKYGQGGYEVVKSIADRDAITDARKIDKVVFVRDTAKEYLYDGYKWLEQPAGASLSVKDTSGVHRIDDVKIIEVVGATVSTGDDPGKAVITVAGGSTGGIQGITVTEDGTAHVGVETLETASMKVSETSAGVVRIQPQIHVKSLSDPSKDWYADNLVYDHPLRAEPLRDTDGGPVTGVRLGVEYEEFEPRHIPSFLAYIGEATEVTGLMSDNVGHHDGAIWFDSKVTDNEPFIVADPSNKTYGIQEFDGLDPNISGGANYLVILRTALRGKAPADGSVRLYIKERDQLGGVKLGYMLDVNSQPMAIEHQYKAGDDLGVLQVMGVVNAKTIKNFSCHIIESFNDDNIVMLDRTEGGTGLCIQALTKECKTGDGLQQFELDTNQSIRVSSHFLGDDRMNINYLVSRLPAPIVGPANDGQLMADGMLFHSLAPMKMGKMADHIHFEDNGTDLCDFYFGKIFSAEETILTRGKTVDVVVTLEDKSNAFWVSALKWTGIPDQFNPKIYENRNIGGVVWNTGWEEFGALFISKDVVTGDHQASKTFTVPLDAKNYAIIIRPLNAEVPCVLQLKQFDVNVNPSITGFFIKDNVNFNESHLAYSEQHKRFYSDNTGFDSLRYTVNNADTPLPCGYEGAGLADITIDRTMNLVAGSDAPHNEGCLKFNQDGVAVIHSRLRVASDGTGSRDANVEFYWARMSSTGVLTKIPASSLTIAVKKGAEPYYVSTPSFTIDVAKGDMLALRVKGDIQDGAYLESVSGDTPLMETFIDFAEATADTVEIAELVNINWPTKKVVDKRVYTFTGNTATFLTLDVEIPAGVELGVMTLVSLSGTTVTKVNGTFQYDNATKKLRVNLGSGVKDGKIYLEFWG